MKPGDLVKLEIAIQRDNGKIGIVVDRVLRHRYAWMKDSPRRFFYDVMVEGEVRQFVYDELLELEDWSSDGTG
jgi:hypothetical protein